MPDERKLILQKKAEDKILEVFDNGKTCTLRITKINGHHRSSHEFTVNVLDMEFLITTLVAWEQGMLK